MPSRPAAALATAAVALVALGGCGARDEPAPAAPDVVARVGTSTLTEADLADDLDVRLHGLDSAAVRRQAVEAWVVRELLVAEARRAGLDRDPEVERRLEASARAVLEAAARNRLLDASVALTPADVAAAYEARRASLALREPYVRLRHLRVPAARASAAEAALAEAVRAADPDAAFASVARRFASDPEGAVAFAASYTPLTRLAAEAPALAERAAALTPGPQTAVVPDGAGGAHVVQVADRVAEGTVPPLSVVEAELAEGLRAERRRDAEARLLERLRAEAVARGDLEVRTP